MKYVSLRALFALVLVASSHLAFGAPAAPSGLTATPFSTTRVDLAWNDNSSNESNFEVYRAPVTNGTPGTFALVATIARNVRTYSDTGRAYGTPYAYRVRATQSGSSPSGYTSTVITTTLTAVTLRVSGFPASATAGASATATVALLDSKGNPATGYPGTVHFSSSDPQAVLPANVGAPTGSANVSVTLRTAGTQTIAANDVASPALTGNQAGIAVAAAAANHLILSFTASVVPGSPGTGSVVAYDAFNNVARSYRGSIGFATSSANAALPPVSAFTAAESGTKTFSASLNTAGTQSLSVTDVGNPALTAAINGIVVSAGNAAQLTLAYPPSVVAGVTAAATVTALDAYGNVATGYRGSIAFSSSSASAGLPAPYIFTAGDAGSRSFDASLNTAGVQSLSVVDAGNAALSAVRSGVAVSASNASRFAVAYPASVVAGTPASLTVTALDAFGNLAPAYRGTLAFASSSTNAALPASYAFTAADAGTHSFNAALNTAGTQSLTATDAGNAAINGVRSGISVSAGATAQLTVTYPASVAAGAYATATVSARDAFGNLTSGYRGSIAFSSSSANAYLPAAYTFTAADAGTHNFNAAINTAGLQSLTATDVANATITGIRGDISVSGGAISKLAVSYPAAVVAGVSSPLVLTAQDSYGNLVSSYTGTVTFTSNSSGSLPANYTFTAADAGTHGFSASLTTAGSQLITVRDTAVTYVFGTRAVVVTGGDATTLTASQGAQFVAGTPVNVTVTARDAFGNVASGYRGTVTHSTSSAQASLPPDYTFTPADNGVHVFGVTLNSRDYQSLTVRDTGNGALAATLTNLLVRAGPTARFVLGTATFTAGTPTTTSVSPYDQFGNWTEMYRGTIAFSSTSADAVLPAAFTWTAATGGGKTFPITFNIAGTQTITVTDTVDSAVTGTKSYTVNGGAATRMRASLAANVTAGTPASLVVTLEDNFGNVASGYAGLVAFTSTSSNATLPASYRFTSADAGTRTFPVSLNIAGARTVTVRDTSNASLTATADTTVGPGDATRFTVAYPLAVTAGVPRDLDVTARDAYGNTATAYVGSVGFTSTSPNANLPATSAFTTEDAGVHRFAAALNSEGTRAITATDTVTPSVNGTISGIVVTGGPATRLEMGGYPSLITAGRFAGVNVRALDTYGNLAVGYAGTVSFNSSDAQAFLPLPTTLAGGKARVTATLRTAGIQSIGATDATFSALQAGINVKPAPPPCVASTWRNTSTGQIVSTGPGLREAPALKTYGTTHTTSTGPIVMPACPYLTGLIRLPIFMVDYADYEPLTDMPDPNSPADVGLPGYVKATPAEIDWHANGPTGPTQYYRDVSGGQADLEFDVFGWITSSTPGSYLKPRANYITPRNPGPGYLCDASRLTMDVMRNAVVFHGANLATYDSDGNGVMDGAVLVHEGRLGFCNGANLGNLNGSAGPSTTPPTFTFDDVSKLVAVNDPNQPLFANQKVFAYLYNNIPERADNGPLRPVATWTHELGHMLLGYPDYYDNYSQMSDWALSAGHQDIPTHPAAWEKWLFAHWLEPISAASSATFTLDANEIPDGGVYDGGSFLVRVPIDGDPNHVLTIENRWFDAEGNTATQWARSNSRESGLLIVEINLNVDDFPSPAGAPKQVYRHIPPRATGYDGYRAWRVGDSFSRCYTTTCITITPTSPPGAQMQFSLTVTPP